MLHAWEQYGLAKAEREYHEVYYHKYRYYGNSLPPFKLVVRSKIAFLGLVKGKNNPLYLRYLRTFKDLVAMETIPEIQESIKRFRQDNPNINKTAFIMMRFSNSKAHAQIEKAIKDCLLPLGIKAVRADDKQYHDDLYFNILTYIYGSAIGIAVFERIEQENFNPNVAFELGYMIALKKHVCLLKEKTLPTLHTDMIGKLYRTFDIQDISSTISNELTRWIEDKNLK